MKYFKHNIILGGDFNIDVFQRNPKTNKFLNLMLEHRLNQHVNSPTHINTNTTTCIDLLFTNFINKNNICLTVENYGFSDHMGVELQVKISKNKQNITWYIDKRLFTDKNINKYKSKVQNINWLNILNPHKNINQNYNSFHDTLINALNQCIPKRAIKLKQTKNKHWLTKGIRCSCKNKRLLKILFIKSNNQILKEYNKKYDKILKKVVNTSKKLQYAKRMNSSNNKIKTMWQIINERTNKIPIKEKRNIKKTTSK